MHFLQYAAIHSWKLVLIASFLKAMHRDNVLEIYDKFVSSEAEYLKAQSKLWRLIFF